MTARRVDNVVGVDGLLEMYEAAIRLAMKDVRRGPGWTTKQQQAYCTACHFLDQLGVLQYVRMGDADDERIIDEVV